MRKLIPFLLLAAFLALLIPRMLQSMAQSAAYPEWSTHRSDPLGAKVLFLALQRTPGLTVTRSYEPWRELRPTRAMYVFLGAPPRFGKEKEPMEKLLAAGGVALLALRPASAKSGARTEEFGYLQQYGKGLVLKDPAWSCLAGSREDCALAELPLGRGRLRLLADAAPLRNGDLHQNRQTALLAKVFSAGLPVVFEESHLGVADTGGVGVLLSRYRLFPLIGLLLAAALLFVWRNAVSVLPPREPVSPGMAPQPAASLRTLLAQRVPPSRLLDTLVEEWKRSLPLLPSWHRGRAAELDAALERARLHKDPRLGYEELRAAIRSRKVSS